jgi:hypothetical protein
MCNVSHGVEANAMTRERPKWCGLDPHEGGAIEGQCPKLFEYVEMWWDTDGNSPEEHDIEERMLRHEAQCEICTVFYVTRRLK